MAGQVFACQWVVSVMCGERYKSLIIKLAIFHSAYGKNCGTVSVKWWKSTAPKLLTIIYIVENIQSIRVGCCLLHHSSLPPIEITMNVSQLTVNTIWFMRLCIHSIIVNEIIRIAYEIIFTIQLTYTNSKINQFQTKFKLNHKNKYVISLFKNNQLKLWIYMFLIFLTGV